MVWEGTKFRRVSEGECPEAQSLGLGFFLLRGKGVAGLLRDVGAIITKGLGGILCYNGKGLWGSILL